MKILSIAFGVAFILCMTGCSKKSVENNNEKITIKVWSPSEDQNPTYGQWLNTMCERFDANHPEWNLSFVYGVCSESNAKKLVPQDVQAAADVFLFSSTGLEQLCNSHSLAEFGGKYLEEINKNYPEVLISCLKFNDELYGVPMTTNSFFMYYDKSVFTKDDVKNLEKMLSKGKVAIPLTNGFYSTAFYLGAGCDFFDNGTRREAGITLNNDNAVSVTDYLVDIVKNDNFIVAEPEVAISMMREGNCNAYWCGTWQASQTKDILKDNFGVCPIPAFTLNGKQIPTRPFGSCKAIGVNSTTKYPQICIELAMFLGGYEGQLEHYKMRNYVPCYNKLVEESHIKKDAVVNVDAYTNKNLAIPRGSYVEMGYLWNPMESFGIELRDGVITHENAREKTMKLHEAVNNSGVN